LAENITALAEEKENVEKLNLKISELESEKEKLIEENKNQINQINQLNESAIKEQFN